jgi:hypothetical protein
VSCAPSSKLDFASRVPATADALVVMLRAEGWKFAPLTFVKGEKPSVLPLLALRAH